MEGEISNEIPLIRIRPAKGWGGFNLRDLWAYRELLYFLTWRDIKIRYKQTILGVAWAIIQPLFAMLMFTLFFGKLAKMPSDGIPYPVFAYAGLLPWTFFSNAVTNSGNSLVGNSNLITKVYFPRVIIPGAAVCAGIVDFLIASTILLGLMFYYGIALTWSFLIFPLLMVITTLLALGVGMWVSALNVKYRDIRYALPFLIQLWMFATPIIYPLNIVPERFRWVMLINPLSGLVEAFRATLLGRPFNWVEIGLACLITFALLAYSFYVFRRMEKSFADVV
ncbi:MAG: phosphate ABC transporter permease [Acidobacteria bacterium 13_1_20CM_3_53_8]|nr:MAG: phosphate ABC transporter permease [Acidobacteria bacterium 13_1_20CM_3_53_8]